MQALLTVSTSQANLGAGTKRFSVHSIKSIFHQACVDEDAYADFLAGSGGKDDLFADVRNYVIANPLLIYCYLYEIVCRFVV